MELEWSYEAAVEWVDDPLLRFTSLLIWADNVFVLADSWDKLQRRVRRVEELFGQLALRFSTSSLELVASVAARQLRDQARSSTDTGWQGPVRLSDGREFREPPQMVALGVALDWRADKGDGGPPPG